jgi:hypothetical protein
MQQTTRIDVARLRDWLSDHKRRMAPEIAAGIVARFYCQRLVAAGYCPLLKERTCDDCQARVLRIFELDKASNPQAMATWRAKEQAAYQIDDTKNTPSPDPTPDLFHKKDSNPFEDFLHSL